MKIVDMNDHKNGSHGTSVVIFLLPIVSLLTSLQLRYCLWNIVTIVTSFNNCYTYKILNCFTLTNFITHTKMFVRAENERKVFYPY